MRQRQEDKAWERRGGDQEVSLPEFPLLVSRSTGPNAGLFKVLKLEWSAIDRRRRQQKDTDIDGLIYEDELEDIPELTEQHQTAPEDDMMVDTHAMEEEAELEAMRLAYEAQNSQQPAQRSQSPSMSDDEYDDLFMDLLSQQGQPQPVSDGDIVLSGQMDLS